MNVSKVTLKVVPGHILTPFLFPACSTILSPSVHIARALQCQALYLNNRMKGPQSYVIKTIQQLPFVTYGALLVYHGYLSRVSV